MTENVGGACWGQVAGAQLVCNYRECPNYGKPTLDEATGECVKCGYAPWDEPVGNLEEGGENDV